MDKSSVHFRRGKETAIITSRYETGLGDDQSLAVTLRICSVYQAYIKRSVVMFFSNIVFFQKKKGLIILFLNRFS